jgi:hypothetical protein
MGNESNALTPEQAEQVLLSEVILPAFVQKCAANGTQFSSIEQVQRAYQDAQLIKAAAVNTDTTVVESAHNDLCKALGLPTEEKQAAAKPANDERVKQAVAVLSAAAK